MAVDEGKDERPCRRTGPLKGAFTLVVLGLLAAGCQQAAPPPLPEPPPIPVAPACTPQPVYSEKGKASWYGPYHQGKKTANGEIYDMNKLTAAHRRLPLGTQVKVTNLDNNRSVIVRVNDRGPYIRGRILDLSRRAAEDLGFKEAGTVMVRIDSLEMTTCAP